jgi:hypothetical protein
MKMIYKGMILIIITIMIGLELDGCLNKSNNYEFKYFEKISGVKFPNSYKVQDYYDNGQWFVRVKLKLDTTDVISLIKKYKIKNLRNNFDTNFDLSYGAILINNVSETFNQSKFSTIPTHQEVYYIDSCTKMNRILYIMDKKSGDFWGIIEYPDWSGDSPCGKDSVPKTKKNKN